LFAARQYVRVIALASAILCDPLCTYVRLSCGESVYTFSTPSGIGINFITGRINHFTGSIIFTTYSAPKAQKFKKCNTNFLRSRRSTRDVNTRIHLEVLTQRFSLGVHGERRLQPRNLMQAEKRNSLLISLISPCMVGTFGA
jgi:hypothetical protein